MDNNLLPPPPPSGHNNTPIDFPEDRTWAMFSHLSIVISALLGGFVFIGPLLVWALKKDESVFTAEHSKEALNFSISWTIWIWLSFLLACVTFGIGLILTGILGITGIILSVIAAFKANDGKFYYYPLTIKFVK